MYDLTEAYLMTTYICALAALLGALLFGGGALAPLAVRVLDEPAAAKLLRAYWPRYYKTAIAIGGLLTLIVFAASPVSALPGMFVMLLGALAFAGAGGTLMDGAHDKAATDKRTTAEDNRGRLTGARR